MGKQSAEIYYQGKTHSDIYMGDFNHWALYIGNRLFWKREKPKFLICNGRNIATTEKMDKLSEFFGENGALYDERLLPEKEAAEVYLYRIRKVQYAYGLYFALTEYRYRYEQDGGYMGGAISVVYCSENGYSWREVLKAGDGEEYITIKSCRSGNGTDRLMVLSNRKIFWLSADGAITLSKEFDFKFEYDSPYDRYYSGVDIVTDNKADGAVLVPLTIYDDGTIRHDTYALVEGGRFRGFYKFPEGVDMEDAGISYNKYDGRFYIAAYNRSLKQTEVYFLSGGTWYLRGVTSVLAAGGYQVFFDAGSVYVVDSYTVCKSVGNGFTNRSLHDKGGHIAGKIVQINGGYYYCVADGYSTSYQGCIEVWSRDDLMDASTAKKTRYGVSGHNTGYTGYTEAYLALRSIACSDASVEISY